MWFKAYYETSFTVHIVFLERHWNNCAVLLPAGFATTALTGILYNEGQKVSFSGKWNVCIMIWHDAVKP